MATKYEHTDVMDAALNLIKSNAVLMTVCKGDPDTRTKAVTSSALADVAMTKSDFTVAASGTGKKITVTAKNSVAIDANGSAAAICLTDATRILLKTTCTTQALTSGNKVNIPSFKLVIAQPT